MQTVYEGEEELIHYTHRRLVIQWWC